MTMEILKTTVGHILEKPFPENMVFTIASFLVEDLEEKEDDYKAMCATLYGKTMKNKTRTIKDEQVLLMQILFHQLVKNKAFRTTEGIKFFTSQI